jgi:hypothetical protein
MAYLDILSQRDGFGKNATGGAAGPLVTVTSLADSGPGTLRAALVTGNKWIRFASSGTIQLASYLRVPSNVTIDGRNVTLTIKGSPTISGLRMDGASNVILLNFTLDGGYLNFEADAEGADAINIRNGNDFWLHHLKILQWSDAACDVKDSNVKRLSMTRCLVEKVFQACAWQGTDLSAGYCLAKGIGARFLKAIDGSSVSYNNVIYKWSLKDIQGVKGDNGQLLAWRNMYRRSTVTEVNDFSGGRIQVTAPWFAEGLDDVEFIDSSPVSRDFVDRVKAVCKVSDPSQTLYDSVTATAGPTLPATSYTTTPTPTPTPTLEQRVADLERRVQILETT